ncbi:heavy-metal-associated domain-containing protein [Bdellovibrio reynosensis]|uniref:Heavy-metal-associated domain-containing protein n=1 Tax=Bdellovibrio reynosensis TaxID=2835041 RepID=A0ABY4CC73_9BACT|nr:heavy metal-associated domain-containing protein [Bdellovibrio reynosensis]UOF02572.1 heavy-metal-associated domain-containing protein [Bdellovibrio reynosensis]
MKKALVLAALLFAQISFAETTTYKVEGMHCGSCAKSIKAHVCKMEGLEKCEVSVGKVVISPKAGVIIPQEKIQAEMSKAGDYKITGSETSK